MYRITKLEANDFALVEEASIEFSADVTPTYIVGVNNTTSAACSNMAGKTTLLNMITYCLWGVDIAGNKLNGETLSRGSSLYPRVAVSLLDVLNGEKITIVRYREQSGGDQVSVQKMRNDSTSSKLGPAQENQPLIDSYVGSFDAFATTSIFARHERLVPVASQTKTQKAALLDLLIDSSDLDKARDRAKERSGRLRVRVDKVSRSIEKNEATLTYIYAQRDAARRADNLPKYDAVQYKKVSVLLAKANARYNKLDSLLGRCSNRLSKLVRRIDKLGRVRSRLVDRKEAETSRIKSEIENVDDELNAAKQARLAVSYGSNAEHTCATCGQVLTFDGIKHTVDVHRKKKKKLAEALELVEKEISDEAITSLDNAIASVKEKKKLLQEKINKLSDSMSDIKDEINKYNSELAVQKERKRGNSASQKKILNNFSQDVQKYRELNKALSKKKKVLEAKIKRAEFWVAAFGPTGIRRHRINSLIPELNAAAKNYGRILFNSEFTVRFSAFREGATGNQIEEFCIDLIDRDGSICVMPSAGQKTRRDIVALLALGVVASMTQRRKLALLMLDEMFSTLDAVGIDSLLELMKVVTTDTNCTTLVVEHSAQLHGTGTFRTITANRTTNSTGEDIIFYEASR